MGDVDTITITRGRDAYPELTITLDGDPLDLTGKTVTWGAKANHTDAALVLGPLTCSVVGLPTAGVVRIPIPDTAVLPLSAYLWDAKVVAGADSQAVAQGVLHVLDAVLA